MSTIKTSNLQNGSSSSVNIALNTDGSATFAQVPGTPYSFLRNRIINGAMVIDQRNAGAAVNGSGGTQTWPVDRFYSQLYNTTGNTTGQQSSIAPSGFTNSMRITVQTADTSVGASDQVWYGQNIEGFNTADFAFGTASALPITLSFWVYGNVTGTYCVAFKNSAENRTYVAEYSITVADTWQRKTITLPGDITGTWLTNNGTGLKVWFVLMAGSSVQTTANAWSSAAAIATSNQVNFMSSTANYWQITGVQLETGSVATPFERRLFGQEFSLCQRYYEKSYDYATAPGAVNNFNSIDWNYVLVSSGNVSHLGATFNFKQLKRAQPTMTYYSPATGNSGVVMDVNTDRTANQYNLGQRTANVYVVTNDANGQIRAHWTANAEL